MKAWLVTIGFSAAGLAGFFMGPYTPTTLPNVLFYGTLVLNTFFSVRFFASIIPQSGRQIAVDGLLVLLYVALAFVFGDPVMFSLASIALFLAATTKYMIEIHDTKHLAVIRKKVLIDMLGVVMCLAAYAGSLAGFPIESAWILTAVFASANVYFLLVSPMYRL